MKPKNVCVRILLTLAFFSLQSPALANEKTGICQWPKGCSQKPETCSGSDGGFTERECLTTKNGDWTHIATGSCKWPRGCSKKPETCTGSDGGYTEAECLAQPGGGDWQAY